MLKQVVAVCAAICLASSFACAKDVLRVSNRCDKSSFIVVQQQTSTDLSSIRRWARVLAPGGATSAQLPDAATHRVVIAYELGKGGQLNQILATAVIDENNFYCSGDAVLILAKSGNQYCFRIPLRKGESLPTDGAEKKVEMADDEFRGLIDASDKTPMKEERIETE